MTKTPLSQKQAEYEHDADMRKTTAALIITLLIVAAAGISFVNLGSANPFTNSQYSGKTGTPSGAPSPVVSIFSPVNNEEYNTTSLTLTFNATVEKFRAGGYNSALVTGMRIDESYYTADWLPKSTQIDLAGCFYAEEDSNSISVTLNLTEIPDGKHVMRVFVLSEGKTIDPFHWYTFETVGYSKVSFTVDTVPPSITIIPIENATFTESRPVEIPLNFTLNEPAAKISYVLDGSDNVTVQGNTTLYGMNAGKHNVTVFAWDAAGNAGRSETVAFTVAEPFPTIPVAAISTASVTALAAGLVLYRGKRHREAART